jgi:acetyltransferase-like isoleucine patch superfamily enzyme
MTILTEDQLMSVDFTYRLKILSERIKYRVRSLRFYTRDILIGDSYRIGEFTYGRPKVIAFTKDTKLIIGKFCSIAANVKIVLGADHRMDWVSTYPFPALGKIWPEADGMKGHPASKGDVVIGNDVWIAEGAVILSGVKIGDGAVIGSQAVVSKDVAPYAVVSGNPARFVKNRFDEDTIKMLLQIQWWNWPVEKIRQHLHLICSRKIDEFLHIAERL